MKSKLNIENKIKNSSPREFINYFKTLGEEEEEGVIKKLSNLISSKKSALSCKALNILAKISESKVIPPVIDSLEYIEFSDNDVKRICHGKKTMASENQEFKDLLIETLVKLKNPEAINMLIDLYEEQEEPAKRAIIIYIFKKLGNITITEFNNIFSREIDKEKKIFIVNMIAEVGSQETLYLLFKMYKDKNIEVKIEAIKAMEKYSSPDIVSFLIDCLEDRETEVVETAITGLKKYLADKKVLDKIINKIKHAELRKREEIIKYLSNIGDENVIPILLEAMKEDRRAVKITIMESFKEFELKKYRDVIIKRLLKELEVEDIRWDALIALGHFSPPEALPHLLKLLKEEDPEARKIAKHGESGWECRKIIVRIMGNIGDPKAVPHIISALDEKQYFNRLVKQQSWQILIETLAKIASPETKKYLLKSIKKDPEPVCLDALEGIVKMGIKVVPDLLEAYSEKRSNKKVILKALGRIGDERALPVIKKALSHKNEEIRENAVLALAGINCEEKMPLLNKMAADKAPVIREKTLAILGEIEQSDISVFQKGLKDEAPEVRKICCTILGEKKDKKSLPLLEELFMDSSSLVSEEAKKVARQISETKDI